MNKVILVDESDNETGTAEKMHAHREGLLHRAFSVFIFNEDGEMMLQRRALNKYHSPGLWSNTCCSHPQPGEETEDAAHRRLKEEMGFDCKLETKGTFIYKVQFENGLIEHELDHIYTGVFTGSPLINREEVFTWKWADPQEVKKELKEHPERFTYWLRLAIEKLL